jgi:threonine synthase
MFTVACLACQFAVDTTRDLRACPSCGGPLGFGYDKALVSFAHEDPSMWRFRSLLPVGSGTEAVTLGEGGTPLTRARLDLGCQLYWKNETVNPSGSHKDRAMSVALTRARALGISTVFVASAGSTGLAAASYAAAAGLRCVVLVGEEASVARLLPLRVLGSDVYRVHGSVDDALDLLENAGWAAGIHDVSTRRASNPYQAEGPKTIAYEIFASLGRVPDWVVIPVGGGGTLAAAARGFAELVELGMADRIPRLAAVQPSVCATLVVARERGIHSDAEMRAAAPAERPVTIQIKLAHTYAPDGAEALEALDRTRGVALAATDAEAIDGVRRLGASEGIFAEPSSGVVVPAVEQLVRDGLAGPDDLVVGLVCGNGFRETESLAGESRTLDVFVPSVDPSAFLRSLVRP